MNKKYNYIFPIIVAVAMAIGMLAGSRFNPYNLKSGGNQANKLLEILKTIDMNYVDTVDVNTLSEEAIRKLLMELDPHSVYLTSEEVKESMQDLSGNFEGIGIEFNILRDTIVVVSTISGGPSEQAGLQAGDKIIFVNNELLAGKGISTEGVRNKLLGKKGTVVKIKILRHGIQKLIEYTITRDKIPFYSIDASYMIDKNTGYIKINRFSAETATEFNQALAKLLLKGMTNLIVDLSGNPGGYMGATIQIADQFFSEQKLIVYTEGRKQKRKNYYSTRTGHFSKGKLVIIIDEGSASASEILAGAIQDWDRGLIVGRRSFGKGLVQEPFTLSDGSEIRLTVARYYTPMGRFIQKTYQNGVEDYYMEMYHRFSNGEVFSKDSINFSDSLKYKTNHGRIVFGGGGITPDIFVPFDSSQVSELITELNQKGLFNSFSLEYADKNRDFIKKNYPDFRKFLSSANSQAIYSEFLAFIEKNEIKFSSVQYEPHKQFIQNRIMALIVRLIYNNEAFYQVINMENPTFKKAYEVMQSNEFSVLK